jgi:hypothetical protein
VRERRNPYRILFGEVLEKPEFEVQKRGGRV